MNSVKLILSPLGDPYNRLYIYLIDVDMLKEDTKLKGKGDKIRNSLLRIISNNSKPVSKSFRGLLGIENCNSNDVHLDYKFMNRIWKANKKDLFDLNKYLVETPKTFVWTVNI